MTVRSHIHAIILTDSMRLLQNVKHGMGSPDWHVSMVDIHLRNLPCGCTAMDMLEWRETTEQIHWREKVIITSGLHLGQAEVLRRYRHYLRAQSQRHHAIDHLEERGVERGSALPWKDERGPSSIRRTLALLPRERWRNFSETGWSACGLYWAHRYHHLELNWTDDRWINLFLSYCK